MANEDLIYHYTDLDGLLGIVRNHCFWASDLNTVNDPAERIHIWNELKAVVHEDVKEAREKLPSAYGDYLESWEHKIVPKPRLTERTEYELFLEKLDEGLQKSISILNFGSQFRVFSVSFCRQRDLLSQWRGYGFEGGGVCIGFHKKILAEDFEQAELLTVEYREKKQRSFIRQLLKKAFLEYKDKTRSPGELQNLNDLALALCAVSIADLCNESGHRFKISGFEEEKERRLVCRLPDESLMGRVKIRSRSGKVVPYLELVPLSGHLPLAEVISGPAYQSTAANYALESLITSCGYPNIKIQASKYALRY